MKNIQQKIRVLINELNEGIYEKEESIAVSLLGALSGHNTFLLGPPGTAKSLISRRIASVFESTNYFEYLMQRFSTPEEIFGPISLKQLKEDIYERKTEGYLPQANIAFLDEIWKSSPAVLNTLLTVINEKKFKNGSKIEDVPLKALISASNETPPQNQGLEALYDRFLIRLMVEPTEGTDSFAKLIVSKPAASDAGVKYKVTNQELAQWNEEIDKVELSNASLAIITAIRIKIKEYNETSKSEPIYVSDRRWQRAVNLLKASAFFNGRDTTNLIDALLLRNCLWNDNEEREVIQQMVKLLVKEHGLTSDVSFTSIENKITRLGHEIDNFKETRQTRSRNREVQTYQAEQDSNSSIIRGMKEKNESIKEQIEAKEADFLNERLKLENESQSPFVPSSLIQEALAGLEEQEARIAMLIENAVQVKKDVDSFSLSCSDGR